MENSLLIAVLVLAALWFIGRRLRARCDAANGAEWGSRWLNRLDGLNRLFCRHYHRLQHQEIPLPEQGPALLVSNHISGLDPLLLIAAARRPLRFMIATEEYERFGLKWLFRSAGCIPVSRARNQEQALREALRALRDGEVVALFPHGRIHLDDDPERPLKGGVQWLAEMSGAAIYAVRLEGVRGKGRSLSAVWLRSRVRMTSYAPLRHDDKQADCMQRLAALLSGRASM